MAQAVADDYFYIFIVFLSALQYLIYIFAME